MKIKKKIRSFSNWWKIFVKKIEEKDKRRFSSNPFNFVDESKALEEFNRASLEIQKTAEINNKKDE